MRPFAACVALLVASVLLATVRVSDAHGQSGANAPACADPAPLYALRHLTPNALLNRLGIPVGSGWYDAYPWNVRVVAVRPPANGRCHVAIVRAELRERSATSGRSAPQDPVKAATFSVTRGARGDEVTRTAFLSPDDPLGKIAVDAPDLDRDGTRDAVETIEVANVGRCQYEGVCDCRIPSESKIRFASGGRTVELHVGGAIVSAATTESTRAALEATGHVAYDRECPAIEPEWILDTRQGEPSLRAVPGGVDVDVIVGRRTCRGLVSPGRSEFSWCGAASRILLHHEVRATGVTTRESAALARTQVRADGEDVWLVTVPFALGDGDPRPHPIATTVARDEGAQGFFAARRVARGSDGLRLDPGVHLVGVQRGDRVVTYQVTVELGRDRIDLPVP